jgi:hypothetical protein
VLHPKQARYQASLQPDSQEQRLDFSTRSLADVSGFARKSFGGASGGPPVTKALPGNYKLADEPAGSGRQTFLEYVLIAPVPVSKPVAIQNRHRDRLHVHLLPDNDDWRYSPLLCQGKQFVVAHHGWSILMNARVFRAGRFYCWCRFGSSFSHGRGTQFQ